MLSARWRPSAEALLHLAIVRGVGAGAVLHTHSVWSTSFRARMPRRAESPSKDMKCSRVGRRPNAQASRVAADSRKLSGYGRTERPGFENSTDESQFHGFLLKEHGLYTWVGLAGSQTPC